METMAKAANEEQAVEVKGEGEVAAILGGLQAKILKEANALQEARRAFVLGAAGIGMAFLLAARVAGEEFARAIQVGIEYGPEPPFDSGSSKTHPETLARLRSLTATSSVCSPG